MRFSFNKLTGKATTTERKKPITRASLANKSSRTGLKARTTRGKAHNDKKSYCHICQVEYTGGASDHIASRKHKKNLGWS